MIATEEEMKDARIHPAWRDYCAHILIDLNACRKETMYRVDKCTELRHAYEKCQYEEYLFIFIIKWYSLQRRKKEYELKQQEESV